MAFDIEVELSSGIFLCRKIWSTLALINAFWTIIESKYSI